MQHSKYFIEGIQSAHNASVRACRYNKNDNRLEWFKGYDSVDKSFAVFKVMYSPGEIKDNDLDPQYVGSLSQCNDRIMTLKQSDRQSIFVVYDMIKGTPYKEVTALNYK